MQQAAQYVPAMNSAILAALLIRDRCLLLQTLMGARFIIKCHGLAHDTMPVTLVDDEEAIQARRAERPHPPLCEGIGFRCARGCQDHLDPFGEENPIKSARELGVAIMNQKLHRLRCGKSILEHPGQLTGLLGHPGLIGMSGTARQMDASCSHLDQKQDVDCAQAEGLTVKKSQASICCW